MCGKLRNELAVCSFAGGGRRISILRPDRRSGTKPQSPFLEPLTVLDASDDFNPAVPATAEERNVAYTSLDTRFNLPHDAQCLKPEKELELEIKATRARKAFQVHTSIPPSSTP
jgi:hypothetical protein